MKKKKLAVSIAAVALAVATIFTGSDIPSVKAADVVDKIPIDLEIDGRSEEKQISKADSDVINKAFEYDSGTHTVIVCGDGSVGYIDWSKSSVPFWKVYETEVFMPDLSRDAEGNLVVKTDDNGRAVVKENSLYGRQTVYVPGYDDPSGFRCKISWGDYHFSPNQTIDKADYDYIRAEDEINVNMGLKTYDDVYIVRICYTTDDKMNYTYTSSLQDFGTGGYDINGNYFDFSEDDAWSEYNKDRTFSYIDFWILPEGVSTVLNFADETPAPAPSDETYTVDLGNSLTVSNDTFNAILAENATKDVVIKSNNDVTFTFAKGTMASVDGKTEYDFSTSIVNAYADTMPSYITKDNFVSQINFNYSGKLPATADIRFYVGTQYAGQTLYYSLMNADNTFAEVQSVTVDAAGYMTVKQDHCSNYVVTNAEPKLASKDDTKTDNNTTVDNNSGNGSTSNNGNTTVADAAKTTTTSPKTGDATPIALYVMLVVVAAGTIVFAKKRKMA